MVSAAGLRTAKLLKEHWGIPYTVGLPLERVCVSHGKTLVIGEDVRAWSLAQALGSADALDLFSAEGLAAYHTTDEQEIREIAAGYDNVIADPVFRPLVSCNFVPMPTVSVSGGIYEYTVSPLDTAAIAALLV